MIAVTAVADFGPDLNARFKNIQSFVCPQNSRMNAFEIFSSGNGFELIQSISCYDPSDQSGKTVVANFGKPPPYIIYVTDLGGQTFTAMKAGQSSSSGVAMTSGVTFVTGQGYQFAAFGGNSNTELSFACPAGKVIIGLRGSLAKGAGGTVFGLDNIGFVCGAVLG